MAYNRKYIGARYVLVFDDEQWSNAKAYEPLTAVSDDEGWYVSRQYVPVGIGLDNMAFWVPLCKWADINPNGFTLVDIDAPATYDADNALRFTITDGSTIGDGLVYLDGETPVIVLNLNELPVSVVASFDGGLMCTITATDSSATIAVFSESF